MQQAPLALSDSQLTTIFALVRPLAPDQRTAFLEMLAAKLNGRRELGDGVIYRLCRELQKEFFAPPTFDSDNRDRKYTQRRARAG